MFFGEASVWRDGFDGGFGEGIGISMRRSPLVLPHFLVINESR